MEDDLEDPIQNQSLLEQWNEATTLTRTQRFLGFAVCFAMGMLLSLLAPTFILRPVKLATTLTLGNLLSIGSMMFLVGPVKQCSSMLDARRRLATMIYITSLVLTLVAAFAVKSMLLCLLCIAVQYCALAWYSLSYIPYGQAFVKRMLGFPEVGDV
jgi:phosphatidylserine synthase